MNEKLIQPINYKEMQRIASLPLKAFAAFGKKYDTPDGPYFYKNNGSRVLFVAHLDSVNPFTHFDKARLRSETRIFYPTVDDRAGAYVGLYYLPKLGLLYDVLLTDGEEKGASTAQWFKPKKKYNWMFSFDRMGTDAVLYQYRNTETVAALEKFGFRVGHGSYSDIAALDDIGCKGFNIGTAYYDYHNPDAYVKKGELLVQVAKFVRFFGENKDHYFTHEAKYYHTYSNLKQGGAPNKGASKSYEEKFRDNFGKSSQTKETTKAFPAGNISTNQTTSTGKVLKDTKADIFTKSPTRFLTLEDGRFLKSWDIPQAWWLGKEAFIEHEDLDLVKDEIERLSLGGKGFGNITSEKVCTLIKGAVYAREGMRRPVALWVWLSQWQLEEYIQLRLTVKQLELLKTIIDNHIEPTRSYVRAVAISIINGTITELPSQNRKETSTKISENLERTEGVDNCTQCSKAFKVTLDSPESLCPKCKQDNQVSHTSKDTLRMAGILPLIKTGDKTYDFVRNLISGEFEWFETEKQGTEQPTTAKSGEEDFGQSS